MSKSTQLHMCAKHWLINFYICCVCVAIVAEIDYTVMSQSCDELKCENSNACHSLLFNDTPSTHSYCACKGEWAGLRCEAKLTILTRSVTTDKVTLEVHGSSSTGHDKLFNLEDLYISEMTIALWNLNDSDQCLMLRRRNLEESSIILEGLVRDQKYLVCITNGFVDSCSFLLQNNVNSSTSSNCLYFETKLEDEPIFDVGLLVVPCTVIIFIIFVTVFLYCERHSLLVQLCLNKVCCRNCYYFRKHLQRRRRLVYKQRDISSEVLMSSDHPVDIESASDTHTAVTGDSSHVRTRSSNASSSTSRRSACSLDPEGSVLIPTSLKYNTFLYENQSLIAPLYSPQDQKIMTLAFIDDDFITVATDVPNCTDPLQPRSNLPNHIIEKQFHMKNMINCNSLKQHLIIPPSIIHESHVNHFSESNLFNNTTSKCQHTGPLKQQQHLYHQYHPYLLKPYNKNRILQHKFRSKHPRRKLSNLKTCVILREQNPPHLNRRPCSLPLKTVNQEPIKTGSVDTSVHDNCNLKHLGDTDLPYKIESIRPHALSLSKNGISNDKTLRSVFEGDPTVMTNLFNSPTKCCGILKDDKHSHLHKSTNNLLRDVYTSNTLPRSRKPRLPLSHPIRSVQDSSWFSGQHKLDKSFTTDIPLQKPTWLDIPNKATYQHLEIRSQPSTPIAVEISTATSELKSQRKRVKSIASHFEHNLSFLKSSKSKRPTYEEKEFRDLQSPISEERDKISKKSRVSSFNKTGSKNRSSIPNNIIHRHSFTFGVNIFKGHPSEHSLPPFSTDDEDEGEELTDTPSSWSNVSDDISSSASINESRETMVSSYDDDDTNLVTPFVTDDSSDDDTYKDINSLSVSLETLQDENLEAGHSLLN